MRTLPLIILLICGVSLTTPWNLINYNIAPNYYVSSVAVYRSRAFLALPRSSCFNNISNPTLVEVPWYSDPSFTFPPRKKPFALEQIWGDCNHVQDAVSLDVHRAKLYVLDKGGAGCPAKIVLFNLLHGSLGESCALKGIQRDKLRKLIVDPVGSYGPRAYVGFEDLGLLLVVALNELKWWRIELNSVRSTQFLAIAWKERSLFMTGRGDQGIFSIDLDDIRETEGPLAIVAQETTISVNSSFLGDKLGISSGLVTDLKNGLSYYLIRDFAVVRWDHRSPPQAEFYDVLAQSFELLPFVSELITGPQNGIWAVVNPADPEKCLEKKKTASGDDDEIPQLKSRLVKVMKYNKINKNSIF